KGLISIDYSIKDYSSASFSTDTYIRNPSINSEINNALTNNSELRVGGEYKIEAFSLRAGYRFEKSPYKNKKIMGDLNGYSGGIGYDFGSTKLDISYATAKRNSQQQFFSQGFTDGPAIRNQSSTITATLLFEL
ncbi:MAG: hypothetical protein QG594_553, partial [Bacteroidota bacterium]|nr:hypothetical protein [Bacteroidota bacterium]